jgi:hypothetical protein
MSRSGAVISSLAWPHPGSGRYLHWPIPNVATPQRNNGDLCAICALLPAGRIDRLCLEVTTAGSAGAIVRLGAYQFSPTGFPVGALIVDAGTVDATTGGAKELAVSIDHPGGPIWLAAVNQGAPTTLPQIKGVQSGRTWLPHNVLLVPGTNRLGFMATGVTGGLPDPFPAGATMSDFSYPYVWVRYA